MKKSLHFAVFCILLLLSAPNTHAQLADGSTAPNFTLTDLSGNTHQLYDYLNQGKSVILDFFAVWCGPCWQSYTDPQGINAAYAQYGPQGDNSVVFLALEADNATNNTLSNNGSIGNWLSVTNIPIINNTQNVPNLYALTYFPTVYIVCPDKKVYEIPYADPPTIGFYKNAECATALGANNAAISYLGEDAFCSSFTPIIELQNKGTNPLTSVQITVKNGTQTVQTLNWSGSLATFASQQIALNAINATNNVALQVIAAQPNGLADADNSNNQINLTVQHSTAANPVTLQLHTDFWPEEISWQLKNDAGAVLYQNGAMQCNQTYTTDFDLTQSGCYTFEVQDSYGDGILNETVNSNSHSCTTGNPTQAMGSLVLSDNNGTVLFNEIAYGIGTSFRFYIDAAVICEPLSVALQNPPLQVCGMATPTIFTAPEGYSNYQWAVNGGTVIADSNPNDNSISVGWSVLGAATVSLSVTDANGCTGTTSNTVFINSIPTANAGTDKQLTCSQTSVVLGTTAQSGFTYQWSGPGINDSNKNMAMPTVSQAGTYQLTVFNGTCNSNDQVLVSQSANVPLAAAAIQGIITCNNSTATLQSAGSSSGANITYQWATQNGNIVSGANAANAVVNEAGQYTLTVTNTQNGCNASATVSVQENTTPYQTNTYSAVCEGIVAVGDIILNPAPNQIEILNFNNYTPANGQIPLDEETTILTAKNGCDSVIIHHTYNYVAYSENNIALQTCNNAPANYAGYSLSAANTHHIYYTNNQSCIENVEHVTVNTVAAVSSDITMETCAGEPVAFMGQLLYGGQNETFVLQQTDSGCDSIVVIHVVEKEALSSAVQLSVCAGESLIFNNTELQGGDVETFTFASALGCDSLVTVTVNEIQSFQTALTLETCAGESITFNNTELQGGDVETFTFASASGCDSLVTVTVNELQSFQTVLTLETCAGESLIFNNTELQGGDVETFTFASALGCDSLVTVTVNELQSFQTALTLETCAGESIIFNDTELQGGDVETFTFVSASGCDSLVTVTVNEYVLIVNAGNDVQLPLTGTISLVPTLSDNQNELDITWYGAGILAENAHTATQIISEAGTYVLEIQNSNLGCTVTDTVVVAPRDAVMVLLIDDNVLQAPEGYSYQWYFNGELIENADAATYTAQQSGNYWVVITDAAGFSNSSEPMQVNIVGLQNDNEIRLQIAPNPSGGVFYINSSQPLLAWELYNMLGELVLEKQYFNNVAFDTDVDICHLPDGMYFLQLYHTSTVSTQHLIVKTGK